jgi:pyridoxamine 5'-phosphate oxidase family protein
MSFTTAEIDYLRSQLLGRLATVGANGVVQANPVGFRIDSDGTVVIGGRSMATTRKYRNVAATGRVALVVDDIVSRNPWTVRGIEIRGRAEATATAEPVIPGTTTDIIRIFPERVISWGVEPGSTGMTSRREVSDSDGSSSASASAEAT